MGALKLGKLPERTPIRLTVALSPELHRLLCQYASAYQEVYAQEESVVDLIPFMLAAFLESDRDFARARRARNGPERS